MRKKRSARAFLWLLTLLIMVNAVAACSPKTAKQTMTETKTAASGHVSQSTEAKPLPPDPLLIGYPAFYQQFSPFYADNIADNDLVELTGVKLLTKDRSGKVIDKAISGQTVSFAGNDYHYTGIADLSVVYDQAKDQTSYTWKIRDDVHFSNGELLTADDVIFNYYVYCDPSYDGPVQISSLPLLGLMDYRTQTSAEVYQKYAGLFNDIYAAGPDQLDQAEEKWSKEQQDSVWDLLEAGWRQHIQGVIDYSNQQLLDLAEDLTGFTVEEILQEEGLQVMASMVLWEVADLAEENILLGRASGQKWDLAAGDYPSAADFYTESHLFYEGNPEAYFYETRLGDEIPLLAAAQAEFVALWGPADEAMGPEGIPNIAGIKKLSASEVELTVEGYDAATVYLLDIQVAPLNYYGDLEQYDYARNMFGFPFGDLSEIKEKTGEPLGAGPYKFVKYEGGTVYLTANQFYYKGEAMISDIQLKETSGQAVAFTDGRLDLLAAGFDQAVAAEVKDINKNGQLDGDKIGSRSIDSLSYRYIGINAKKVNVAGQPDSEASKNLRRGLATVLAVYREMAVEGFHGELAAVLDYPASAISWAAPQPTDKDYQVAFSTAADGSPLYDSALDDASKYAAANQAALDYFLAAGFTLDETGDKLLAAPEGAKLSYEIIIPGGGKGDHPAYQLALAASSALAEIGMELKINDLADTDELWDALDAGSHELWSAGWKLTPELALFNIYHSTNVVGLADSSADNSYNIIDKALDQLIEQAMASTDHNYRRMAYRRSLDIIMDWAVEIPFVQQKSVLIFKKDRLDPATLASDITPYWSWLEEIELLQFN